MLTMLTLPHGPRAILSPSPIDSLSPPGASYSTSLPSLGLLLNDKTKQTNTIFDHCIEYFIDMKAWSRGKALVHTKISMNLSVNRKVWFERYELEEKKNWTRSVPRSSHLLSLLSLLHDLHADTSKSKQTPLQANPIPNPSTSKSHLKPLYKQIPSQTPLQANPIPNPSTSKSHPKPLYKQIPSQTPLQANPIPNPLYKQIPPQTPLQANPTPNPSTSKSHPKPLYKQIPSQTPLQANPIPNPSTSNILYPLSSLASSNIVSVVD